MKKRLNEYDKKMLNCVVYSIYSYAFEQSRCPHTLTWWEFKTDYAGVKAIFIESIKNTCGERYCRQYSGTIKKYLKKYIENLFEEEMRIDKSLFKETF